MMLRRIFLSLSLLLACQSCDDEFSQTFCNLPARFTYNPVSAVSQLYSACNSMGQWCTITISTSGNQFVFSNTEGSTPVNRTQVNNYSGFYLGLSGFFVGLPNIPELGKDYSIVTCYDRACRTCYDEDYVTKPLALHSDGTATCPKCNRTYDLNNQGIISQGEAGKSLYRYRVTYTNNTLVINNR